MIPFQAFIHIYGDVILGRMKRGKFAVEEMSEILIECNSAAARSQWRIGRGVRFLLFFNDFIQLRSSVFVGMLVCMVEIWQLKFNPLPTIQFS